MKSSILLVTGFGVATVILSSFSSAQDYPEFGVGETVLSGDYKPLSFLTSLSVGASYYTNPQRARASTVAYAYEGPEFADSFRASALWSLARQNRISFGIREKDKKTISVVPLDGLQKFYPVNQPDDLTKVLAREDVTVVANEKTLLGQPSKETVVKTAK